MSAATAAFMNGGAIFLANVKYPILNLGGDEFHELRGDSELPHSPAFSFRETD
jgi:hypothetical protein